MGRFGYSFLSCSRIFYFLATESTEEHGKINIKAFIFLCSSVGSVATISFQVEPGNHRGYDPLLLQHNRIFPDR